MAFVASPPAPEDAASHHVEGTPTESGTVGRRTARMQARAYYELTKPGIAGFVMITAGAAFVLASRGQGGILPLLHTLLGTLLGTGGALALNQYVEREVDGVMTRTRGRPIPSGRLRPAEALVFGAGLTAAGIGHLWFWLGWLPAFLTALSAVVYVWVYTPMKKRSYLATLTGAFPGSAPALIGWSAATGDLSLAAYALFATMFVWQLPHVVALAWLLREDYARAGFHLIPAGRPDQGDAWIGGQLVFFSALLVPVSLVLTPLGVAGWIYFWGALVLGGVLLWWSVEAGREMSRERVRKLFLASLAYHPLLLTLLLLDMVR